MGRTSKSDAALKGSGNLKTFNMMRSAEIFFQSRNSSMRGSVLMEFILVFPIYLVLFGGVFLLGDMAIHSLRLASAERTAALELQSQERTGWSLVQKYLFHVVGDKPEITDLGDIQSILTEYDNQSVLYPDDTDYQWSHRAAVKSREDYKLPLGGTAARLLFAALFFDETLDGYRGYRPSNSDDALATLLDGGRVKMYSKNTITWKHSAYNYQTLKRTTLDSDIKSWRDNRRNASDLVAHSHMANVWNSQVYRHSYYYDNFRDDTVDLRIGSLKQNKRRAESAEYKRYDEFVKRSN